MVKTPSGARSLKWSAGQEARVEPDAARSDFEKLLHILDVDHKVLLTPAGALNADKSPAAKQLAACMGSIQIPMPASPVEIGKAWEQALRWDLPGSDTRAKVTCTFDKVDATPHGKKAFISIKAVGKTSGLMMDGKGDMVFSLEKRIIEKSDIRFEQKAENGDAQVLIEQRFECRIAE